MIYLKGVDKSAIIVRDFSIPVVQSVEQVANILRDTKDLKNINQVY